MDIPSINSKYNILSLLLTRIKVRGTISDPLAWSEISSPISKLVDLVFERDVKRRQNRLTVAGGNGRGDCLTHLAEPQGMVVNRIGRVYVADLYNHRVMCYGKKDINKDELFSEVMEKVNEQINLIFQEV